MSASDLSTLIIGKNYKSRTLLLKSLCKSINIFYSTNNISKKNTKKTFESQFAFKGFKQVFINNYALSI